MYKEASVNSCVLMEIQIKILFTIYGIFERINVSEYFTFLSLKPFCVNWQSFFISHCFPHYFPSNGLSTSFANKHFSFLLFSAQPSFCTHSKSRERRASFRPALIWALHWFKNWTYGRRNDLRMSVYYAERGEYIIYLYLHRQEAL